MKDPLYKSDRRGVATFFKNNLCCRIMKKISRKVALLGDTFLFWRPLFSLNEAIAIVVHPQMQ